MKNIILSYINSSNSIKVNIMENIKMYKLWAKKIKKHKIIASLNVRTKDNDDIPLYEKRDKCVNEICKRFDISVPIWLDKHKKEFAEFKTVTFYAEDFIDEIDFDKLEIELVDDKSQ